ncbi:LOW QUALITY PROTEIN: hypothetical protein KIPB_002754 [Kipferlia bialata]|uniref:CTLH domain-containing protein n=1 Tax=Kipferlia bialata TaxID=797122 RepID=A0A9K3CR52_9EUKA|nr:LOW QUALITY PROTEIN: hypothetical protein KIPB_002754 [Kipferlia bialata]
MLGFVRNCCELDNLVLNYFVSEGLKDAALAFAEDSGLEVPHCNYYLAERACIRDAILSDQCPSAITLINDIMPDFFESHPSALMSLLQRQTASLIGRGQEDEALELVRVHATALVDTNPSLLPSLESLMLVFVAPEAKAARQFSDPAFREGVASSVNAMLLQAMGAPSESQLSTLMRICFCLQDELSASAKLKFPRVTEEALLAGHLFEGEEDDQREAEADKTMAVE